MLMHIITENAEAKDYLAKSCPIASFRHVTTKTCEVCPWFGGFEYEEFIETKEHKHPWIPDIQVYENGEVVCKFTSS
jgi:hypothetical protein